MKDSKQLRKGSRVLFAAWRDSHVTEAVVVSARQRRGEVPIETVEPDGGRGVGYWRKPSELLVVSA